MNQHFQSPKVPSQNIFPRAGATAMNQRKCLML
jgi:hypothetical protein